MTDSTELGGLLERVRATEGADRELDYAIEDVFRVRPPGPAGRPGPFASTHLRDTTPRYSSSLDAAIGLVERVAPKIEPLDLINTALAEMFDRGWDPNIPRAPQIARALIAALLASLQEDQPHG